MKLDRMLAITLELMAKKRVRASDLAARFEVSTRTIYREIELINQAGIPVVSYTGADGGFELMDGFFLTKQHFTVQDLSVIYRLLHSVEGAVGNRYTVIRDKLQSLHPKLANDEHFDSRDILFDLSTGEGERDNVRGIYGAIGRRNVISFLYQSASGTYSKRRVEPIRLYWERGAWYVEGYCLTRCAKRLFRASRMTDVGITNETFQPREPSEDGAEEAPLGMDTHLRFDKSAEPRVSELFAGETIHEGEYIDVKTVFYQDEYALSVVLSFGSKVVVLEPQWLRVALLERLEEIRRRYEEIR
jgi:predicted DNA-binding transcriptional regulator YafY